MYEIFSVDDHIVEPADLWVSRVQAKYRDAAPHVIEEDSREYWVYEDHRAMTVGLNAVAGKPREEWSTEPTRFSDMIPGCYDPAERALDLLSQGVLASVGFPTLPRFGGMLFNSFKDKHLADQCVRAWNDFVIDEWCPGGPAGLFVPMIMCQVWDPALAAAEVRRGAERGAKALCFVENPVPDGLPGFHGDHWDPLWDAVQETDLAVCLHIASSGYVPLPDPAAPATNLITLFNVCGMLSMVNLLMSPVCHRFPRLRIAFSEAGIGWIPAVLERADRQVERHQHWSATRGELKPSEIFARNMYACMVEEPIGLSFYGHIGADRILAETDYPHSDTIYPRVQEAYAEVFAGIPDDVVEMVTHTNAERLFDWKMADSGLLESAEVTAWREALEADPHAATRRRHDVAGVEQIVVDHRPGSRCSRMVLGSTQYRTCGKVIDADGRCEAGHVGSR